MRSGRGVRRTFAVLAAGLVTLAMLPVAAANAATTDIVVNVSTDRGSYSVDDEMTTTIEVTSRGPAGISAPAALSVSIPLLSGTTEEWNNNVTCTASGGAVCPTAYQLTNTSTLAAQIATLPPLGKLTLKAKATVPTSRTTSWSATVTASVAVGEGDTDPTEATNTATTVVTQETADTEWAVGVTGPSSVASPGNTTITYQYTITNNGTDPTAFYATLKAAAGQGTGSSGSSLPYIDPLTITGITCASGTGGATCADAVSVTPASGAVSSTLVPSAGATQYVGSKLMPGGSTLTFNVEVQAGPTLCSSGADALRNVTLTATINPFFWIAAAASPNAVVVERTAITTNNTDSATTALPALACGIGDLTAVNLTLSQGGPELAPGEAFTYGVDFTNSGVPSVTATNAQLQFSMSWPATGLVMNEPVCTASGSAVCPTAWTLNGSLYTAVAPTIPPGGSLHVDFSGTAGADRTDVCRPQSAAVFARITPPADFFDVVYNPQTLPNMGNNRATTTSQTSVGSACGETHDDQVTIAGPYADPELTTLLTAPAAPGQAVYFKSTIKNLPSTPGQPFSYFFTSVNFTDYPMGGGFNRLADGFTESDASDPDGRWQVSYNPGDPASLPLSAEGWTAGTDMYAHPTGVRCIEADGTTCPVAVGGGLSSGGGASFMQTNGWRLDTSNADHWAGGVAPSMADSGSMSFVTTYRVPPYRSTSSNGQCSSAITSDYLWTVPVTAKVEAKTDPVTLDRQSVNDSTGSQFTVLIKACTSKLDVAKTITYPTGSPAVLGPDRLAKYKLVVTNTSSNTLDVPWLRDVPTPVPASATIECVSTTGNAVCPDYTPQAGVPHRVSAGTAPTGYAAAGFGTPLYDFEWGAPGANTMPPGSSVTFEVTAKYSLEGAVSGPRNMAILSADPASTTGSWNVDYASVALSVPSGTQLGLQKNVTPTQPKPGKPVTFTINLFNPTAESASNVYFTDLMHPILQAANPDGFANLTCRPLTADEGVFGGSALNGTPAECPDFTSSSNGIAALLPTLPGKSGLQLTYTAIAPKYSASAPNIAQLTHSDVTLTAGDAEAQANLSVLAVNVSGTVWHDEDLSAGGTFANIQTDDETGTPADGLIAVLIDQLTGEVIATTPIADDGTYEFTGVEPGIDVTVAIVPASTSIQPGDVAPAGGLNPGWIGTTPVIWVPFNTGVTDTTDIDFGVVKPASVGDYIWYDANNDGVQQDDEKPAANVKVELLDAEGNVVATTTSDANGYYLFDGLFRGTYEVRVTAPAGTSFTGAGKGGDTAKDSDFSIGGLSGKFTLAEGEARRDIDAGLVVNPASPTPTPSDPTSPASSPSPSEPSTPAGTPSTQVTPTASVPTVTPSASAPGHRPFGNTGSAGGVAVAVVIGVGSVVAAALSARRRRSNA